MKLVPECLPCMLRQAMNVAKEASADRKVRRQALSLTSLEFRDLDFGKTPAFNSNYSFRAVQKASGCADPYLRLKKESNARAARLLPEMERIVRESADTLRAAALVAVAGNIIDFGISDGGPLGVEEELAKVVREGFAVDDLDHLRNALKTGRQIVYVADNAGEIYFDRELVKLLVAQGHSVVFAVHSGPILNDALVEDAKEAGLDSLARVVETGSDMIGLEETDISQDFRTAVREAGLVIAKGQGNFETVSSASWIKAETYMILKAKCLPVARELGVGFGRVVLKRK